MLNMVFQIFHNIGRGFYPTYDELIYLKEKFSGLQTCLQELRATYNVLIRSSDNKKFRKIYLERAQAIRRMLLYLQIDKISTFTFQEDISAVLMNKSFSLKLEHLISDLEVLNRNITLLIEHISSDSPRRDFLIPQILDSIRKNLRGLGLSQILESFSTNTHHSPEIQCPSCNQRVVCDGTYCGNCGQRLLCPKCKSTVWSKDAKYCHGCGMRLN